MSLFSDTVVGMWVFLVIFLLAAACGWVWWIIKTRNMPLRSDTPANDGEQRHDEFVTEAGSQVPPSEKTGYRK